MIPIKSQISSNTTKPTGSDRNTIITSIKSFAGRCFIHHIFPEATHVTLSIWGADTQMMITSTQQLIASLTRYGSCTARANLSATMYHGKSEGFLVARINWMKVFKK